MDAPARPPARDLEATRRSGGALTTKTSSKDGFLVALGISLKADDKGPNCVDCKNAGDGGAPSART